MKVSVTEIISAPVANVFEVMSDIPSAAERVSGIVQLEVLGDIRSGKGVRWRETRVMFGKEATEVMEITEFSPPNHYRVEAQSHGMKYVSEWRFRDIDGARTEVSMVFTGTPLTLAAKLMTPLALLFQGATRKALHQDVLDCKRHIETAEPRSAGSR